MQLRVVEGYPDISEEKVRGLMMYAGIGGKFQRFVSKAPGATREQFRPFTWNLAYPI